VVIGSGISGLASAFELVNKADDVDLVILEGQDRVGGNIRTLTVDDCIVDAGPDGVLTSRPEGIALCRALELEEEMMAPSAEASRVLVAHGDGVSPLPEGLVYGVPRKLGQIARTPLLTWRGRVRAAMDLVLPRRSMEEISVGELVGRRLGREMKDHLIEPIVGGIFAGDIDRLDAAAATPLLASAPRSLIASMMKVPRADGPPFRAPKRGMSRIVEALTARIGHDRIRKQTAAVSLARRADRWEVAVSNGDRLAADDVIVAAPPFAAARLVRDLDPALGEGLDAIRSLSTAAVVLVMDASQGLPAAGGLLIPRVEERTTIAATFASIKWPDRAPHGRVVLRAFVGGDRAPVLVSSASDAELVSLVLDDLGKYFRLPPLRSSRVVRFQQATPSPEVGHGRRVGEIRARAQQWTGLHFAGGGYGSGVGLASCAAQARDVATAITGRWNQLPS
jgi:oxygen-dependent protoporphyrinogen oxidase